MRCSTTDKLGQAAGDEQLMLAVARGDLAAFGQLVLRHQAAAWRSAYRFLGDRGEAEDMVQEAFLRVLDAAPRYRPEARFRTYLFRILSRLCLDHVQKKRPRPDPTLAERPDARPSVVDGMSAREAEEHVRHALKQLPSNQRLAVLLRYYEDLSYADIATAMETSVKAVERLLARGRHALEASLAHLLE
jgi:RNA polymerase sigma-70 factor (ECF subfamily)